MLQLALSKQIRVSCKMHESRVFLVSIPQDIILAVDGHVDEDLVLTASKDNSVRVWRGSTGRCLGLAEGHVDAVGAVACAPRSCSFCVSGSNDK